MLRECHVFNSRLGAEAWRDWFLSRYPHEGYGTTVSIEPTGGGFLLTAYRQHSCD